MKAKYAAFALTAMTALTMTALTMTTMAACGRTKDDNSKSTPQHKVQELNTEEFKEKVYDFTSDNPAYLTGKPAIVDFYASWCGPCKQIAPILEELAEEYGDKIAVYKIDIGKEKKVARAFNISSIPAVLYIPAGKDPVFTLGARSKAEFKKEIEKILLTK